MQTVKIKSEVSIVLFLSYSWKVRTESFNVQSKISQDYLYRNIVTPTDDQPIFSFFVSLQILGCHFYVNLLSIQSYFLYFGNLYLHGHNSLCSFVISYVSGEAIMCHRCFSSMGGCGADGVVWRMFPWRDCGDSQFCVKVITKEDGVQQSYIVLSFNIVA